MKLQQILLSGILTLSCLFTSPITLHSQNNPVAEKHPNTLNGLDLSGTYTKEQIIKALGEPTQYDFRDYSDEGLGYDETYIYKKDQKELIIECTSGEIMTISCDSPQYLLFGNLRVGENINIAREMIKEGFGRLEKDEELLDGYKCLNLYLGDISFYISYKNSLITSMYYNMPY